MFSVDCYYTYCFAVDVLGKNKNGRYKETSFEFLLIVQTEFIGFIKIDICHLLTKTLIKYLASSDYNSCSGALVLVWQQSHFHYQGWQKTLRSAF